MKVGSLNIRGLRAVIKKKKIRSFISEERLDVIAIQETKLEHMEERLCEQLLGDTEYGWIYHPAIGNGRGMLSMWNAGKGNLIFSFSRNGFLGVYLEWGV